MSKKKYYHNNWAAVHSAPSEWFFPIPFDEFMDWKIAGWEIPSSVACMIRETDTKTGKVREYIYNKVGAAKARTRKIMEAGNEFIVCTADDIQYMYPEEVTDYDDPLA
tara:strand:- start:399 stop:722 length:324 start_codon:yes stop_codon:yes gene_type:complete